MQLSNQSGVIRNWAMGMPRSSKIALQSSRLSQQELMTTITKEQSIYQFIRTLHFTTELKHIQTATM